MNEVTSASKAQKSPLYTLGVQDMWLDKSILVKRLLIAYCILEVLEEQVGETYTVSPAWGAALDRQGH